jgi:hypothetical protein
MFQVALLLVLLREKIHLAKGTQAMGLCLAKVNFSRM